MVKGYAEAIVKFLEEHKWKVVEHTVHQDHDGDGFHANPNWGEGALRGFACKKNKQVVFLLVLPDRSGTYNFVCGPDEESRLLRNDLSKFNQEFVISSVD